MSHWVNEVNVTSSESIVSDPGIVLIPAASRHRDLHHKSAAATSSHMWAGVKAYCMLQSLSLSLFAEQNMVNGGIGWMSHWVNGSLNEWGIGEWVIGWMSHWMNGALVNESLGEWVIGWMSSLGEWVIEWMGHWWMSHWVNGSLINKGIGWMGHWVNGPW